MEESLIICIRRLEQISKTINSLLNGNIAKVILHLRNLRILARELESCLKVINYFLRFNEENLAESNKTAIQSTKNESSSTG